MAKLKRLKPLIGKTVDARAVRPEAKTVDPFYMSPEYRAWRQVVLKRAGYRCEAVDNGVRCSKAAPHHRMFADHIRERRDAPHLQLDTSNGRCLCGSHHTTKTVQSRADRLSR